MGMPTIELIGFLATEHVRLVNDNSNKGIDIHPFLPDPVGHFILVYSCSCIILVAVLNFPGHPQNLQRSHVFIDSMRLTPHPMQFSLFS
jgi:hypothetical protein